MAAFEKELIAGIEKVKAGDWEGAHKIAQSNEGFEHADWFHAILHKIEGDAANSRYWYSRTDKSYEDYPDARAELEALRAVLQD